MGELSLIQFNFTNFFAVVLNHRPLSPVSTIYFKIVKSLLDSVDPQSETEKKDLERLDWIYKNTHKQVREPLPDVEYCVFQNIGTKLDREIEFNGKTFKVIQLYRYLDEITLELTQMVITIAKKYNLEIPIHSMMARGNQPLQL
jgi:hypothetical protein